MGETRRPGAVSSHEGRRGIPVTWGRGVTGSVRTPRTLLLGRYDTDGRLQYTGRTTALPQAAARSVAVLLPPSRGEHPWTGWTFSAGWGSREVLDVTLVRPELVVEVSVDVARRVRDVIALPEPALVPADGFSSPAQWADAEFQHRWQRFVMECCDRLEQALHTSVSGEPAAGRKLLLVTGWPLVRPAGEQCSIPVDQP